MQRLQRRHENRGGFTLLEVLIVLAIIGVIAAMVVPNLVARQRSANIQVTKQSIKNAQTALDMYAVEHQGAFPEGTGPEVLDKLLVAETTTDGRQLEPFLKSKPLDAWQHALNYEYPNQKSGANEPAIWSNGPNGKNDNGGPDDINSWTTATAATK